MRSYDVTGAHPVLGHAPGTSFEAAIPADQEKRLIGSGAIARHSPASGSAPQRNSAAGKQEPAVAAAPDNPADHSADNTKE